jgi:hypothetical protein
MPPNPQTSSLSEGLRYAQGDEKDVNEKQVNEKDESHIPTIPTQPPTDPHLQIPGIAVQGASDDERSPRPLERPEVAPGSLNPSANVSRATSPNPSAVYPHTQVTYEDPDFSRPPPLNYSLRPRKKSIFWFWTLIFLDCVCMPIGLYFGMWYGLTRDQLSANAVFSISTALLGTVSIVEYFIRFRRLWRKNSKCRVIGAQRHYVSMLCTTLSSSSDTISSTGSTGIFLLVGSSL